MTDFATDKLSTSNTDVKPAMSKPSSGNSSHRQTEPHSVKQAQTGLTFKWIATIGCIVWLLFLLAPFYWVTVTAFKPPQAVNGGATYLPFIDFAPTLEAFREVISGIRGDFVTILALQFDCFGVHVPVRTAGVNGSLWHRKV